MKILAAFRLRALWWVAAAFVLFGCAEGGGVVSGPAATPPAARVPPPVDVSAIEKNLQGLRQGMRNQEQRLEEAGAAIERVADALERARKDSEAAFAKAHATLEKATREALEKLEERVANMEGRVAGMEEGLARLRASASPPSAPSQEAPAQTPPAEKTPPDDGHPAGVPASMPPVAAPDPDARVASAGLPRSRGVAAAGLPAPEEEVAVLPKAAPKPPPPAPKAPDPEEDYTRAIRVLREKQNFAGARELFDAFIERYPTHELADDAQFWIGQSYFQEKNFERAILAFNKVQVDYANGDKAPEALLLEALSFLNLGDRASAQELLGRVVEKYPDSAAAATARGRLESL